LVELGPQLQSAHKRLPESLPQMNTPRGMSDTAWSGDLIALAQNAEQCA